MTDATKSGGRGRTQLGGELSPTALGVGKEDLRRLQQGSLGGGGGRELGFGGGVRKKPASVTRPPGYGRTTAGTRTERDPRLDWLRRPGDAWASVVCHRVASFSFSPRPYKVHGAPLYNLPPPLRLLRPALPSSRPSSPALAAFLVVQTGLHTMGYLAFIFGSSPKVSLTCLVSLATRRGPSLHQFFPQTVMVCVSCIQLLIIFHRPPSMMFKPI